MLSPDPVRDPSSDFVPGSAVDAELDLLLRRALARFLREAAERRAAEAPFALLAGLEPAPRAPRPLPEGSSWVATSSPEALARVALRLDPGEAAHLVLARSLLAQGEPGRALLVLRALLRAGTREPVRWRALHAVALAHEQRGNDRLALGAAEAAARVRGAGVAPRVGALFLALAAGDPVRARRAVRLLDRGVDPGSPELRREVDRLALRVDVFRGGRPWRAPVATRALLARLVPSAPPRPSSAVAHVLAGRP